VEGTKKPRPDPEGECLIFSCALKEYGVEILNVQDIFGRMPVSPAPLTSGLMKSYQSARPNPSDGHQYQVWNGTALYNLRDLHHSHLYEKTQREIAKKQNPESGKQNLK